MPYGLGPAGWLTFSYPPWWGWRCRWFPWLPRLWWTGMYGPVAPFTYWYGYPWLSKDEEVRTLEDQAKFLEQQLEEIRKRIDELKK